jgi:hypothetical protein
MQHANTFNNAGGLFATRLEKISLKLHYEVLNNGDEFVEITPLDWLSHINNCKPFVSKIEPV